MHGGSWMSPLRQGVVWPSPVAGYTGDCEAERLGLIKKYRISANQYFTRSSLSTNDDAYIKTALDFRGLTTSKTFVCQMQTDYDSNGGEKIIPLISQGNPSHNTASYIVFALQVWQHPTLARFNVSLGDRLYGANYAIPDSFDWNIFHTYVGKIDFSSHIIRLYVDGILRGQDSFSGNALSTIDIVPESMIPNKICINYDMAGSYNNGTRKTAYAMIFDGIKSDAEIEAFK